MKLLVLLALLLTLDACQSPSRFQAAQTGGSADSNVVVAKASGILGSCHESKQRG
jgi:hypothetical protein